MHEFLIYLYPILPGSAVHNLHGYLLELLLILCLRYLRLDFLTVDVFLQRQQNLVGIHGLDQVVGNLLADGLVHDILLLALGHHHHGQGGVYLLDALQGLKTAETWHLLIKQHQIEMVLTTEVDGIGAVAHRHHVITLTFKKQALRPQLLDFIIHPQ